MPRDKNIFTLNPTSLDMGRSVFSRNSQHKTSFNLGELVPIYFDEILPGDTVSMDISSVIRMMTPIAPIMDNIYADVYFFFIPNRIIWSNWQQLCGENETGAWTNTAEHRVPVQNIGAQHSGYTIDMGDLGDYLGLPVIQYQDGDGDDTNANIPDDLYVSELPLRAVYKVYNDWFRDENSIAPTIYTIGDSANTNIKYSDKCPKVAKFHDLFTSCLPAPQKGASVAIPYATDAPVVMQVAKGTANEFPSGHALLSKALTINGETGASVQEPTGNKFYFDYVSGEGTDTYINKGGSARGTGALIADLSQATAATINQLRLAFQVQKLLEKDARGGTRYIELLRAHFGVTSPDARLQRSEYLAGHRFRINVDQVVATADSGDSGSSIVGQTGAVSKTAEAGSMFTKSFVEHGLLMGFVCLRQDHTYSQGLEKYWLKRDRFDFYYPVLANIGEVPVYKSEICVENTGVGEASGVFGYNEAWYEYRMKPSRASSMLNPSLFGALNYWTLGDIYSTAPSLNADFIQETKACLNRALIYADQPSTEEATNVYVTNQFIADFYFKAKFSRVMPLYSIPGLIDHH